MKRSLIADIRQSESNALLELLGRYRVTVEGVKGLGKAPQAFMKQFAVFIERQSFSNEIAKSVFPMFNAVVGRSGRPVENITRPFYALNGGTERGADQALVAVISDREIRCQFVLMDFNDFGIPNVPLEQILDDTWLQDWCSKYLVGFKLRACPQDTPPYIVSVCRQYMIGKELWIASPSLSSSELQLFVIKFRGDNRERPWLTLAGPTNGPCYGSSQILFRVESK